LLADAQDAVQEAWLRLARLSDADRAAIRDPCGWLTTVVGRLCLDRLRSAAVQRERDVGSWLPEQTCWSSKSTPTALSGPAVRAPYGRLTPPLTDAYRQVLDGVGVSRCKPGAVAPL
jgi:DNA-directed RNA polymerase specialized sigma24 family protein